MPESGMHRWLEAATGLRSAALTEETLQRWQLARLRQTVAYARQNSRYYAAALRHVEPEALTGPDALQQLPLCSSDALRAAPEDFLCVSPRQVARITTLQTSGSTGRPKRVFFTRRDLQHTTAFFAAGMSCMAGPGERVLILMPGKAPGSVGALLSAALLRLGAVPTVYGAVTDYAGAGRQLTRLQPDCIVGIPAQVARLAKENPGCTVPRVLLSADYIPESVVRLLRQCWGADVFSHYGMTEMGFGGAVDCAGHMGYHLRSADLLFEVIHPQTGQPCQPGEVGEIVFSTLRREAMPLLRYRTGDLARLLPGRCICSLPGPRLGRILGRRDSALPLPGGRTVSIHWLDELLLGRRDILDYTARLGPAGLELAVCPGTDFSAAALRHQIENQLGAACAVQLVQHGFATGGAQKRSIERSNSNE